MLRYTGNSRGLSLAAIAATAGCLALSSSVRSFTVGTAATTSLFPFVHASSSSKSSSTSTITSLAAPNRLVDLLPKDLNMLFPNNNTPSDIIIRRTDRFFRALGIQLLLFGGWEKTELNHPWTRRKTSMTIEDRLHQITPTWKPGGMLDYSYPYVPDAGNNGMGIFDDNHHLFFKEQLTCMEQLANTLEFDIGLDVSDFDPPAQRALQAMLSWQIPPAAIDSDVNSLEYSSVLLESDPKQQTRRAASLMEQQQDHDIILLIFSFDSTPDCYSVENCPRPGPTNELLAATAKQYTEQMEQENNKENSNKQRAIRMIAQWEVAAALEKISSTQLDITAVGTPGKFQNTAEIFELMLSELLLHQKDSSSLILLAHPDHLRRVLWTAQTILHNNNKQNSTLFQSMTMPSAISSLQTAMQPYGLNWPFLHNNTQSTTSKNNNLYKNLLPTKVHTQGQEIMTNWYDEKYLGFFPDGDPQKWTRQRDVWILYDQWAIAKGIVTGTIDVDLVLSSVSNNKFLG